MALTKVIGDGLGGTNDLTVDTTTLTVDATNDLVGIKTATPSDMYYNELVVNSGDEGGITILDTSSGQSALAFADGTSGNARYRGRILYDHNTDSLSIGTAGEQYWTMDSAHIITTPKQPAFGAIGSSAPTLPINTTYVLPLDTERFDQNGDYNTSNYTFTAPVTGRYQLNGSIYLYNYLDTSAGYIMFTLRTSNDEYQYPVQASMFGSDIGSFGMNISHLVDMDASDTAVIDIFQQAGAAQTSISGGHSHFTGFLVA